MCFFLISCLHRGWIRDPASRTSLRPIPELRLQAVLPKEGPAGAPLPLSLALPS